MGIFLSEFATHKQPKRLSKFMFEDERKKLINMKANPFVTE